MRRAIGLMFITFVVTVALCVRYSAEGRAESVCVTGAGVASLEFLYRLEAGEERVTPRTIDAAIEIVCER